MVTFVDMKLTWPSYQDMPIKALVEIGEAFTAMLKAQFDIETDFEVTSQGIVATVDLDQLNAVKDSLAAGPSEPPIDWGT